MLKEIKSFEINKIYHITLDTSEFEDNAYQLDYKDFNKNDLICIHLIDNEQNVKSNIIMFFEKLKKKTIYCEGINSNEFYYFYYDTIRKVFVKEWGV